MITYTRKCVICGKKFTTDMPHRKLCSEECDHKRRLQYWKQQYEKKKENKRKKEQWQKELAQKEITDKCIEARKQNISYGELQKRKYLESHETIKERIEREKQENVSEQESTEAKKSRVSRVDAKTRRGNENQI